MFDKFVRFLRRIRVRWPIFLKTAPLPPWVDEEAWGREVKHFGFATWGPHLRVQAAHRYPAGTVIGNARTGEFVRVANQCSLGCLVVERGFAGTEVKKWRATDSALVAGSGV